MSDSTRRQLSAVSGVGVGANAGGISKLTPAAQSTLFSSMRPSNRLGSKRRSNSKPCPIDQILQPYPPHSHT
ncbi:hypothetical protein DTO021D3_7311 [Paecilomyces variotii]|nr:hypothetical protein DTO032I3_7619 [Paecilomyces variotii]KAJ9275797.1 hypothetical protein DTO021D3_7311 [Paecilomyces variotii]KAJ9291314.1 hypothetical protein DTO021C3_1114 [Paecilomyces variotii]KAJ9340516.1 hypothetical protein DTO027B6_6959 [Paecilomyces variotii]KAJ9376083.1 hypothetical protein DTO032I4_8722 [Paecilomyces variotii]